jgi:L-arabinose transport system ATP-binding protein
MAAIGSFIEISGVSKRFGAVQALRDVSVAFRPREVCALMGENGAGKSTLMRILEGEHQPDSGSIEVDGRPVHLRSAREAHGLGIRVIHQEPEIIPELTVAENIFVGDYRARGGIFIDTEDLFRRARAMIASLGVEGALSAEGSCRDLGPAQRQLIEIMRALRPGARLLAFDEPTSSLTEEEAGHLFATIRRLRAEGVGIVYISHRLAEVLELADRCVILRDGQKVADLPVAEMDEERMIRLMVGRPVTDLFHRRKRNLGSDRLSLEEVCTKHVRDITFTVRAGEIVGLGGLIGSGRTEVARAIVGMDLLTDGKMSVSGSQYAPSAPSDSIRAGIGLVPEDRKKEGLLLMQSVRDNVSLVVSDRISRFGFVDAGAEALLVDRHVSELRIKTPSIDHPVGKLSGGNQQKVIFARWQARSPQVLIFDEPTRGIDVGAKAEIYRLIEALADEGMAILLISSEMQELLGLSDRILVMRDGRLIGELDGPTATEEAVLNLAMTSDHHRT